MGFDVTCPTCSEVFFIEKESPDETKKSFKEPNKPNPPKKYHQEKTKKTFVVKNWMLYAGYYVVLILIPIIMLVLGAFLELSDAMHVITEAPLLGNKVILYSIDGYFLERDFPPGSAES